MKHALSPLAKRLALFLLLQFGALLLVGFQTLHSEFFRFHKGDIWYYYSAAWRVLDGQLPYRDFLLAYPPFSIVPFLTPLLLSGGLATPLSAYAVAFLVFSAVLSTGIGLLLIRMTSRWRFAFTSEYALGFYALLVVVFSNLLPWRYDLFPALLTLISTYCLLTKRSLASGLWLGLGIAAKLYPIVLLPVFALFLLAQKQKRPLAMLVAGCVGSLVLCLLPFARLDPHLLGYFLRFHAARGLEVESLGAGAILLAHWLGWTNAWLVLNYGAFHVGSPSAGPILRCLPLVFAGMLGIALVGAWRTFRREQATLGSVTPETLIRYTFAALLVFLAANKVFSTSYVIWLLPFAPLLRKRDAALTLILFLMTITIYPFQFDNILEGHLSGLLLLNGRNLLLLGLLFNVLRGNSCSIPISSWLRSSGARSEPAISFMARNRVRQSPSSAASPSLPPPT